MGVTLCSEISEREKEHESLHPTEQFEFEKRSKPSLLWVAVNSGGSWISATETSCKKTSHQRERERKRMGNKAYPLYEVVLLQYVENDRSEDGRLENPHEDLDEKPRHTRSCDSGEANKLRSLRHLMRTFPEVEQSSGYL